MFIGYYNKSVILTYIGLFFGIVGMQLAFQGNIFGAHLCLLASGVCDMFDGKIARMCKRNKKEKMFGIELDSLADTINFVVFPIILFTCMGYTEWYYIIIYCLYALTGITRLGYFNVDALSIKIGGPVKYYSGLPVTTSSFIFPIFYILSFILESKIFQALDTGLFCLVGFLFVYNFKIKKPSGKILYFFLGIAIILTITLLLLKYL